MTARAQYPSEFLRHTFRLGKMRPCAEADHPVNTASGQWQRRRVGNEPPHAGIRKTPLRRRDHRRGEIHGRDMRSSTQRGA